jgi:asparagine synthase (glutamine-hydrolysing)
MCGIFGALRWQGFYDAADQQRFLAATNLASHRGPDDCGFITLYAHGQEESRTDRFQIFLGHRRLSIIDLSSAGHQPMTDGQDKWIIFNGEIFNYIELREELKLLGHQFRTATDTEVILHIYSEYGEKGFDRLNGMWAFAIVDLPQRKIVLSRDRFSMKPLYLAEDKDGGLFFASEIKQLLPFLPQRKVNKQMLLTYLSQALVDHTPNTFFEGITQVSPRTNVTICLTTGKMHSDSYWDYERQTYKTERISPEDATHEFRRLLIDSTRIRLRSDVEVGVLLSGGLDSSALALISHQLQPGGITSYSVVSNITNYSEGHHVDALCRECGIANEKITFSADSAREHVDTVLQYNDEPVMGFSAIAQFNMLQTIKQRTGIKVLLSGQGGDELLLGYLKFFFFYVRQLIEQGRLLHALALITASLRAGTVVRQFRLSEARRYMSTTAGGKNRSFFRIRPTPIPVWNCETISDRQIQDLELYSVPALTHYEDRVAMAHSMELRHPFLDHRLVNFALTLPTDLKLKDGWTKYILRQAFPELPSAIRWRKDKQPFLTPEEKWIKEDFSDAIQRTFCNSRLSDLGILNDQLFQRAYSSFCEGSPLIAYGDISRVLIAERWLESYFA